tara:strand:+ start:913 stop:1638 length:726 start_codon:yes stop_codon:yes gene_type:complete
MATALLEGITDRVRSVVGPFPAFTGDNEITDATVEEAIKQARNIFSQVKPRITIEDETGDDGKFYPLSDLANWDDDFSEILSIDWDAGTRVSSDEVPRFLNKDNGDWTFYRDATVRYLFFPKLSPSSSLTFRVEYTSIHVLDDTTSTIPLKYEEAIIYLAVSRLARIIQFRVEKGLDPPMGTEFVTMRNKGSGFKALAEDYQKLYIKEMGGEGVPAASAIREYDLTFAWGHSYAFHAGAQR